MYIAIMLISQFSTPLPFVTSSRFYIIYHIVRNIIIALYVSVLAVQVSVIIIHTTIPVRIVLSNIAHLCIVIAAVVITSPGRGN